MAGELGVFDHRRAFEEQLLGGRVLQAFSQAAGAEDGAQLVQLHLLADVEEEKSHGRAPQGRVGENPRRPSLTRERGVWLLSRLGGGA